MASNALTGVNLGEFTEHRGVRECLQWFTREKQWINEIHLQLCRIPAPTFLEQERAAWFADQLRSLGWNAGWCAVSCRVAIAATLGLAATGRHGTFGP